MVGQKPWELSKQMQQAGRVIHSHESVYLKRKEKQAVIKFKARKTNKIKGRRKDNKYRPIETKVFAGITATIYNNIVSGRGRAPPSKW